MFVLGIETSCDETAVAVVKDGKEILSNIVASQHDIHEQYGGVFPELASRRHVDRIVSILDQALRDASITLKEIDLISASYGPGLIGALLVGLNAAKTLSLAESKPFIGINHIEAHLYAALMSNPETPIFPCIGVILSGAHTHILHVHDIGKYTLIAQTIDDAAGEAFDKVARILGLPYPGGPRIEALAKHGNAFKYPFKAGYVKRNPIDFSFSGIKTGVLYTVKGQNGKMKQQDGLSEEEKCDIAASFQRVVFEEVIAKTLQAAKQFDCETILFGGGVTNNSKLREMFAIAAPTHSLYWPSFNMSLDNAAMIAGLAYHQYQRDGKGNDLSLEPKTRIPLG